MIHRPSGRLRAFSFLGAPRPCAVLLSAVLPCAVLPCAVLPCAVLLSAVLLSAVAGCGGPTAEVIEQQGESSDNFRVIESAYRTALKATGRAPKNRDDLAKHLPPDADAAQLFVSPRDKQPLVVIWGTDLAALMTSAKPVVYGYEAEGADGNRFVLTSMGVMEMTDEDFAAASFPAGHSPPE